MTARAKCWIVGLACSVAACASTGPPQELRAQAPRMVWPEAPEVARVEFVSSFSSAEDLGLRESLLRRTRDLLAGGDRRGLSRPYAVAVDEGVVAVADPGAGAVHLFETDRKRYRRLTGAGPDRFVTPIAVALSRERVFVADAELNKVFVMDRRLEARLVLDDFRRPTGLAFDPNRQRLYVSDTRAHHVKAYDSAGKLIFTIGERGDQDQQFNYPSHLAFSGDRLFVNDTLNFRVQIFDSEGRHLRTFGKHGNGSGYLAQSKGLALDSDGHVYVADALANQVQIFDQDGAFLLGFGKGGDGPGSFQMPAGLAIWDDAIYVADSHNRRVQVFRYLPKAH